MMGWVRGHEVLLALALTGKAPSSRMAALLRTVTLDDLAALGPARLADRAGLGEEGVAAVVAAEATASALAKAMEGEGIALTALCEADYPVLLREIASPPPLLFTRGAILPRDRRGLAIVGSRKPTLAGVGMARTLARDLAAAGFTIVSGLARGIDTAAHLGALEAGGRTIAVLGSGIDAIYPPENCELAMRIAASGAVVTEFGPGSGPLKWNFPRRNRLISGLALGTIVIEAGERSGALITAGFALEQNRTVFAVPGSPGFARSKGTNGLIKQGACLVETAEDVLKEIAPQTGHPAGLPSLGLAPALAADEARVVALLSDAPAHVDEVSRQLDLAPHTVLALLLCLETRGLVRALPGKFYVSEVV